jgi:CheY-like chemotaxis protein
VKPLFLLVDDEPLSTMPLLRAHGSAEFDVLSASTLREASTLLQRRAPHALVVDVNLHAEMTGLQWLRSLEGGPYSKLPTIILSGSSSPVTVGEAIEAKVFDYIIKPSSRMVLGQKFSRLCAKLQSEPFYTYRAVEGTAVPGVISFASTLAGVGDTRISVLERFARGRVPYGRRAISYHSPFFVECGIQCPALDFSFSECAREPRMHRNHFTLRGLHVEERRLLRRWIWKNRLPPCARDSLFDVSQKKYAIRFRETVEILVLSESELELVMESSPEPGALADLCIEQLEIPIVFEESSWFSEDRYAVKARVDPRTTAEALEGLRRVIVGLFS